MKPYVYYRGIDQYRQWVVADERSLSYFPTWAEALAYALKWPERCRHQFWYGWN